MANDSRWLNNSLIYVALCLFGAEVWLVATASVPWLLAQVNADDFYYYLVLAKHTAAGIGPSFDGLEITNGFHPLYLLFVTLLAKIPIDHPDFLIKSSLILLLAFHNATGLVIGAGFKSQGRPNLGLIVGLIWLLNPWSLAITLHGVETPIATFLWSITIFVLIFWRSLGPVYPQKIALLLGILLALAILARTDSLLFFGSIMLTELYRMWRSRVRQGEQLLNLVLIGITTLVITLPWWWWNWSNFGMIIQVSGQAIFLGTHGFDWMSNPQFMLDKITITAINYISRVILYTLLPIIFIVFVWWQGRYSKQSKFSVDFKWLFYKADFAWLTLCMLFFWYVIRQWSVQNWYLLPTVLIVTIGIGLACQQLTQFGSPANLKPHLGILVFTSILMLFSAYITVGFGFPRQERGYYLAQWLNENTPTQAKIGAWNSGIIGYFADRPVVNLDGVVNNSLYHYKVKHKVTNLPGLINYIRDNEITHLTDYEHFSINNPEKIGLQLIYESTEHKFRVYELDKSLVHQ